MAESSKAFNSLKSTVFLGYFIRLKRQFYFSGIRKIKDESSTAYLCCKVISSNCKASRYLKNERRDTKQDMAEEDVLLKAIFFKAQQCKMDRMIGLT